MDVAIDRVQNHTTNSTSLCCDMNREYIAEKPPKSENFRFGLSTFYTWLRFFKYLQNICYRLLFKQQQVTGAENKEKCNNNY